MATTFFVSAKLYWGFKVKMTHAEIMSDQQIISQVKREMKQYFTQPHDLYELREGVDKLKLHLHHPLNYEQINYICDHSHVSHPEVAE